MSSREVDDIRANHPKWGLNMDHGGSRATAIKVFCLECHGGSRKAAKECASVGCPLWPHAFGRTRTEGQRVAAGIPSVVEYEAAIEAAVTEAQREAGRRLASKEK